MTAPASAAVLTGKRRIAFASLVDDRNLPGFLALLRSLALSNPGVCEDYVVLYEDQELSPASVAAVRALHPRTVLRRVGTGHRRVDTGHHPVDTGHHPADTGSGPYALLDVFRLRDHDTVVVLDPSAVVLGDLGELLRLREGIAAVPGDDAQGRGTVPQDPGVLVVQRPYLNDEFCTRLDEAARRAGAEGRGGVLDVVRTALGADGALVALDPRHDVDVRTLAGDLPVPDDTVLLRFTGPHKPWEGGAKGYGPAEKCWSDLDLSDADFRAAYVGLKAGLHHDLAVHLGTPHVIGTGDVEAACRVAEAHIAAGEYQEAVGLLGRLDIPLHQALPHAVLGHALMSVSRYDEARAHLLAAAAAPHRAPIAYARLAQIAWVHGDDEAALAYATAGLSVDPVHKQSRQWAGRARTAPVPDEAPAAEQLAHVAFYMDKQGNAGDKLLPESVRLAFGPGTSPRAWHSVHAHRLFDEAALERVNARRGLVIGGGGLFIPDTMPNGSSGWQWNVPHDLLRRIDVPVMVYAVGFNAFDGQRYPNPRFPESLELLVERAAFFGLRNHGSVEKVRALLPARLHDKIRFQPCPTTVSRQIVPDWQDPDPAEREDTVLLNAAYDRSGLRFGHDYGHFLAETAKAVRAIGQRAEVRCVAHSLDDERIAFDLRREHGITLPVIPMYDFGNDEIRDTYARTRLVIGMRGHAGMIPFGVGTPIISLISHPKMAYFLADIDRPEWGVSVHHKDLGAQLTERALDLLDHHEATVADVADRQQELWKVTQENMNIVRTILAR